MGALLFVGVGVGLIVLLHPGAAGQDPRGLLAVVGVAMLGCAGYFLFRDIQVNTRFSQQKCVVLQTAIREASDQDSTTYRPDILIEYTAGGRTYREWTYDIHQNFSSNREAAEFALSRFQVGQEHPCWYDPASPTRVVLVRGYSWIVFLSLGGLGLVFVLAGVGMFR